MRVPGAKASAGVQPRGALAARRPVARAGAWLAAGSSASIIGLGFAGLALGALIIYIEPIVHAAGGLVGIDVARAFTHHERVFIKRDQTVLWLLLLAGQTATWAVLLVPIAQTMQQVGRWRTGRLTWIYGGAVIGSTVVAAAFGALLLHTPHWSLPGHTPKLGVLTALAVVVAAIAAVGIGCVGAGAEALEHDGDDSWERRIALLARLRGALDRLVLCMGVIVGAAVLATGALRNATISWQQLLDPRRSADDIFPQEHVLLYGLYFTAVIALIAIPTYERLRAVGTRMRDAHLPERWPPAEGWKERVDERAAVDRLLKLELTAAASLRAGVAILAPLASSLLSRALG
jgi:hypothetical protein